MKSPVAIRLLLSTLLAALPGCGAHGSAIPAGPAAPGAPCTVDDDCAGRSCVDRICCAQACPVCQSCTGPQGTCANLPKGEGDRSGPTTCTGDRSCDGQGGCGKNLGAACLLASECPSGICTGGVCCSEACDGICRSCAPSDGKCVGVLNTTDATCAGSGQWCAAEAGCGGVDQQQNGTLNTNTSLFLGHFLAQTFTPGRSGRLVGVRANISCSSNAMLRTELRTAANGIPTDTVRAATTATGSALDAQPKPLDNMVVAAWFEQPVMLQEGVTMALVLSQTGDPGAMCVLSTYSAIFDSKPGDTYAGGNVAFIDPPTTPAWKVLPKDDIGFQTLMAP